jgi:hypothetical protein
MPSLKTTRRSPRATAKGAAKKTRSDAAETMDPRLEEVARAFAKDADVTSGRLMASFGLKVKGKIFAMVHRGHLVVKLPRERVDGLVTAKKGAHFDPGHGRPMKEWFSLTASNIPWLELVKEAHAFVRTRH